MLNIKDLRNKKNLTQTELSQLVGVSLRTVQNWEAGNKNITASKFAKLSDVLGFNMNQISQSKDVESDDLKNRDIKEYAEYVANNYEQAKKESKLFNLTIEKDKRDYLIKYLESKGFKVNT